MYTIDEVLGDIQLKPGTALLGVEAGGRSVVTVNLKSDRGGSIVIYSDYLAYQLDIVRAFLISVVRTMSHRQVRVIVLTDDVERYVSRMRLWPYKHLFGIYPISETDKMVNFVYHLVVDRIHTKKKDPLVLFVLDGLGCTGALTDGHLRVAISAGPRVGVWTIGAFRDTTDLPFETVITDLEGGKFSVTHGRKTITMETILV